MGDTKISWTDRTWNPIVGCKKVSPGCAACYAETMAKRLKAMALAKIAKGENPGRLRHYIEAIGENGKWSGKLIPVSEALDDPFKWKKPSMVFVNSMSDLFHESVPFEFIDQVFASMGCAFGSGHTYQILTKRPERMAEYLNSMTEDKEPDRFPPWRRSEFIQEHIDRMFGEDIATTPPKWPLRNVWLGTSVEDQKRADERIPHLVKCPAAVRFLSCEPLLGPLQISAFTGMVLATPEERSALRMMFPRGLPANSLNEQLWQTQQTENDKRWVIVGCESGPKRRPMKQEWAESLLEQCQAAGVAYFLKQMEIDGQVTGDISKFPKHLQVRQFPKSFEGVNA